jgi:hypothetical protein
VAITAGLKSLQPFGGGTELGALLGEAPAGGEAWPGTVGAGGSSACSEGWECHVRGASCAEKFVQPASPTSATAAAAALHCRTRDATLRQPTEPTVNRQ